MTAFEVRVIELALRRWQLRQDRNTRAIEMTATDSDLDRACADLAHDREMERYALLKGPKQ